MFIVFFRFSASNTNEKHHQQIGKTTFSVLGYEVQEAERALHITTALKTDSKGRAEAGRIADCAILPERSRRLNL